MKINITKDIGTKTLFDLIKEQYPENLEGRFSEDFVDITNTGANSLYFKEMYGNRKTNEINITNDGSADEIGANEIHLYTFGTISDLFILSEGQDGNLEVRISKKVG